VVVKWDINIPNFIPQKHFGGTAYLFPTTKKLGISQGGLGIVRKDGKILWWNRREHYRELRIAPMAVPSSIPIGRPSDGTQKTD